MDKKRANKQQNQLKPGQSGNFPKKVWHFSKNLTNPLKSGVNLALISIIILTFALL